MCPRNRRAPDVLRLQQRRHATRSSIAHRRRAYSARGKEMVRTTAGLGHVGLGHLPALSSQNSQDCKVVTRPAKTRTGALGFGRVVVPMASWGPCQKAVSVRVRSRGPRSTWRRVCGGKPRCFGYGAAAGVLLHTSFVRGRRRPLWKGGGEATQWEGNREPSALAAWCSAPPRVLANSRSPIWKEFCKGAHP